MDERKLHIIPRAALGRLIRLLQEQEYTLIGPTVRENALVYGAIAAEADLPLGYMDRQAPGRYSLERAGHQRHFGCVLGAHSWKRFLFPPKLNVFSAKREGGAEQPFEVNVRAQDPPRYAFLGVRACDLAAIAIQDQVLTSEITDPYYQRAREKLFIVAVNCTDPGGNCFCASLKTGPQCRNNYDLCLTEMDGEYSAEVGSERGAAVLREMDPREATMSERHLFRLLMERAADHMGKKLDPEGLPELLAQNLESPRWEQIARRCLACANCTMVCPTCFCYSVHDHTDLTGRQAERVRLWGSCFTLEFSYLGSHTVRTEGFSRYRQWMTHKLSSWHEQFGMSGCVGCGRCITWCPVGIDLTAEAAAFRSPPPAPPAPPASIRNKKGRL